MTYPRCIGAHPAKGCMSKGSGTISVNPHAVCTRAMSTGEPLTMTRGLWVAILAMATWPSLAILVHTGVIIVRRAGTSPVSFATSVLLPATRRSVMGKPVACAMLDTTGSIIRGLYRGVQYVHRDTFAPARGTTIGCTHAQEVSTPLQAARAVLNVNWENIRYKMREAWGNVPLVGLAKGSPAIGGGV